MTKPKSLRLRDFVGADECYHVARTVTSTAVPPLHTHDFAEVFWIERGRGWHRWNDQQLPLEPGDLVWIRPVDVHTFRAREREGFTLLNIAFRAPTLRFLETRYAGGQRLAAARRLGESEILRSSAAADALTTGRQNPLRLEAFLLNLLQLGQAVEPVADAARYPTWLQRALCEFSRPPYLAAGTKGLARLAGRCPEHVNRVIKQATGCTATDLVNHRRLELAARQLRLSDRKILDIALESGVENLGYFYRLFQRQYGLTPRQYRLRQQALIR